MLTRLCCFFCFLFSVFFCLFVCFVRHRQCFPLFSFSIVIGLVFFLTNEIVKMFSEKNGKEKKQENSSKLNSVEKIISKALIDSGIGHKEFTLIINEEKGYISLKKASEQKTVN